jgi:hypothetical protein
MGRGVLPSAGDVQATFVACSRRLAMALHLPRRKDLLEDWKN